MKPNPAPRASSPSRRVVEVCAMLAGGASAVIAAGWLMGAWRFATFGPHYNPMVPVAAWALLLLNVSVFSLSRWPDHAVVRLLTRSAAVLVGGVGLAVVARLALPGLPEWEASLATGQPVVDGLRVGSMSPQTAGTLVAGALALLFLTAPPRRLRPWETIASVFAVVMATSGLIAVIGYALGGQVMAGSHQTPMALSTALVFILTGAGLIVLAHPRIWVLDALAVPSRRDGDPVSRRFRWALSATVLLLVIGIGVTLVVYLRRELNDLGADQRLALTAIANFKATEIAHWRDERQADADVLARTPFVRNSVAAAAAGGPAGTALADLRAHIQLIQERYGYEWVEVLDAGGRRLGSSPPHDGPVCPETARIIALGARPGHAVMGDLHSDGTDRIGLVLVAFLGLESEVPGGTGGAVLVLHIDARQKLFPSIRTWPSPSQTGETFLVQREGDALVFQTDARHLPGAALSRRVPLGDAAGPVRRALAGQPATGEGLDYRGVPAIVAARMVPGSRWVVIAKVDQHETYALARDRVWTVSLSLGLLGVGVTLGLTLIRRQRDALVLERELKERRRREDVEQDYRTLFSEMLDGFAVHEIVCDADGRPIDYRFLAVNPAFERLTGLKAVDIVGKTVLQILPGTEGHWIQTYGAVALTGEPAFFESYTQGLDKYFQVTAYRPEAGQFACIFQDVTERRRAEERVRQSEEKFALAFQMSPSAISIVRLSDGHYIDVNEAFTSISGYTRDEVLGQSDIAMSLWVNPQERRDAAATVRAAGALEEQEYLFRRRDGEIIIGLVSAHTIVLNGEPCVLTSISDVTERKRTQDLLIQTEKMMSIGGLAAGMAHEINNPLGIIRQAIENVDRRLTAELPANTDAAVRAGTTLDVVRRYQRERGIPEFVQDIRDAASRASAIVTGMLHFSRKSDSSKRPADLATLLEQAILLASNDGTLQRTCDFRRMDIVREYEPGVPPVMVSPIEIEQVLLNLLTNAGHSMALSAATRTPTLVLRVFQEDQHVAVEVEDNGVGMTPDIRRRAFEPFFTTKEPGAGTGLGLSVAYAIVAQNHGGRIEADSVPGHGACFTVRLPVTRTDRDDPVPVVSGELDG